MEHFLEGITLLRHWYFNANEKSSKYKSSFLSQVTKALTMHFLQGNAPLRHILNLCLCFDWDLLPMKLMISRNPSAKTSYDIFGLALYILPALSIIWAFLIIFKLANILSFLILASSNASKSNSSSPACSILCETAIWQNAMWRDKSWFVV